MLKLNQRVKKSKANLEKIKTLIHQWVSIPLFTRKKSENDNFFNKEEMEKCKVERYSGIKECSFDIENLIWTPLNVFSFTKE